MVFLLTLKKSKQEKSDGHICNCFNFPLFFLPTLKKNAQEKSGHIYNCFNYPLQEHCDISPYNIRKNGFCKRSLFFIYNEKNAPPLKILKSLLFDHPQCASRLAQNLDLELFRVKYLVFIHNLLNLSILNIGIIFSCLDLENIPKMQWIKFKIK